MNTRHYSLDGLRGGVHDGEFILEKGLRKWSVYFFEQGDKSDKRIFDTENEACDFQMNCGRSLSKNLRPNQDIDAVFPGSDSLSDNTRKLFTGQRLDSTGLYYYGARYYDPLIGRFVSADPVTQDPNNPQSLNRYSYCVNDPLKYVDPSGLDWMVAGGSGSGYSERQRWWDWLVSNGLLDPKTEYLFYLQDIDRQSLLTGCADVEPRYQDLLNHLNSANYKFTNLKIAGHSEGAATVGQLMADFIHGTGNLSERVTNMLNEQLRAVFLLEIPIGPGTSIKLNNFDQRVLSNVGEGLSKKNVIAADIYNSNSLVHRGTLPGWNSYNVAKWWETGAKQISRAVFGFVSTEIAATPVFHDRIKTDALMVMKSLLAN